MLGVFAALLACLIPALVLNRLDAVRCRWSRPDPLVDGTPSVLVFVFFAMLLLMSGRPWFSALLVGGGTLLLFAVNRLKLAQFKEPLVFVDFGLFYQMLRHPRFYLPYIFPLPVVCVVAVIIGALIALYWLEIPLGQELSWLPRLMGVASICLAVIGAWAMSPFGRARMFHLLKEREPSSDPNTDFQQFGLTGSIAIHLLAQMHRDAGHNACGLSPDRPSPSIVWPEAVLAARSESKPHVVLVQAESFFDARSIDASIDKSLFEEYDRICSEAKHGPMKVSAHGAYTMRTEFSVLTGIPNGDLGTHCMNPYLAASRRPVWSLARHFKAQGYRTICVHPYDLRFFRRDKVMPNLGFDELHGEELFSRAPHFGPYVSDMALAEYLSELMATAKEPLFLFAITIEAHGPWDAQRFEGMAEAPTLWDAPAWGGAQMAAYLTHLKNTDRMFAALTREDDQSDRQRVVGVYGDHVGCVPEDRCLTADTDYFIWSGNARSERVPVRAEELGGLLLQTVAEMDNNE